MRVALLLLIVHGTFLTVLLATVGRSRDPANGPLSLLVLSATGLLFSFWLSTLIQTPALMGWSAALLPVWFLIGPLSLRYVQSFLRVPSDWSRWWLCLPPMLAAAWILIWQMQPASVHAQPVAQRIHALALYGGFWLLSAACALRSYQLLRASETGSDENSGRPAWHRSWLRTLMAMMLAYAALDFVITTSFVLWGDYPQALGYISVLFLSALNYLIGVLALMPAGLTSRLPWPNRPYHRAQIPLQLAQQQVRVLDRIMQTDRPWLAHDLDLASLAGRAQLMPHQLSQLLNQHLRRTFADYVNSYRIAQVQRMLCHGSQVRSILDIGFEAGFGSSTSFYRAFRKHVGQTPSEFLADAARRHHNTVADSSE